MLMPFQVIVVIPFLFLSCVAQVRYTEDRYMEWSMCTFRVNLLTLSREVERARSSRCVFELKVEERSCEMSSGHRSTRHQRLRGLCNSYFDETRSTKPRWKLTMGQGA